MIYIENIIWKDVSGYEGYYQVSNTGLVRSLDRYITRSDGEVHFRKGREHPQKLNSDGYYIARLSRDGIRKQYFVHRLVATAFVKNQMSYPEVNHIDFDPTNNHFDNLEWCTRKYNMQYSAAAGRLSNRCGELNSNYGNRKLSEKYSANKELSRQKQSRPGRMNGRAKPIAMFDKHMVLIKTFDYINECAEYMKTLANISAKTEGMGAYISKSARTGTSYKGFFFKFTNHM